MSADLKTILERLPADQKITVAVCEALDKLIRDGTELNQLQRETVASVVKCWMSNGQPPPPQLESFCAYAYTEWIEEAKTSEEVKKVLGQMVRILKSQASVGASVARIAQEVVNKREARRKELARFAEAMINSATAQDRQRRNQLAPPPKVYVRKMQEARQGKGDNALANLNLAVQIAEEAVDSYPNTPLVLFEAAGCYQLLADKGTHLSTTERYVHLRQAFTLFQRCHECLTMHPYNNLKTPEYDKWRSGTASLVVKLQRELERLQEKQR